MIYLSHFQSFTFLFSSKINGNENKPTLSTFFFCKDPVSMRLVCLGCELENKPELCCSFLRAKMKRLYTTKNEKAHDSPYFSRLCSRLVAYNWSYETSVATLFSETISFGQLPQYRDLRASSPSTFLKQHHSNFPAQLGFPAPGAASAGITAQNLTAESVLTLRGWSQKAIRSPEGQCQHVPLEIQCEVHDSCQYLELLKTNLLPLLWDEMPNCRLLVL